MIHQRAAVATVTPTKRDDVAWRIMTCNSAEGPAVASGGAQGFVADACGRAVFLPQTSVLADRNDRDSITPDDGLVAAVRVIGAVGRHRADRLVCRDLSEQFRQHGAVAVTAGGEFHGADVRGARVHGQMHLAPLAAALHPMLARLPFVRRTCAAPLAPRSRLTALELDPDAVDQQVQPHEPETRSLPDRARP